MRFLFLLLLPLNLFAECRISDVLTPMRPKAKWNLNGNTYEGIEWVDKVYTKPTKQEVLQAITNCESTKQTEETTMAAAKVIVMDTTKTETERFNALIEYLGIK